MKKIVLMTAFIFAVSSVVAADKERLVGEARNEILNQFGIGWQSRHMPNGAKCIETHLPDNRVIQLSVLFSRLSRCAQGWRGNMLGFQGCRALALETAREFEDTENKIKDCMSK